MQNKLLVILGPTASGKTELSIKLALRLRSGRNNFGIEGAEIISADSRQVYKGLDIGSGKITKKEMQGVTHWMLDVANPKRKFTVAQYQKLALKKIEEIQKRRKLPILVGGTGFYIQSVVDGIVIPEVKPDWKLRKELEKLSVEEMFEKLKKLDPKRAKNIDKNNPRRLIRALEIVITTGKSVPAINLDSRFRGNDTVLQIGIKKSQEELKINIQKRLAKRLQKNAMINEVKKLHKNLSWKRLEEFGLEYRFVAQYLQNKITKEQMTEKIQKESEHFAKRQMTWFSTHGGSASGGKSIHKIVWIANYNEVKRAVDRFIKK